jgi:hypothetical protein
MFYSGGENINQETAIETRKIDTIKIKELKQFFRVKKDEFDNPGSEWYTPKSAPNFINQNGLYCYFNATNYEANNLRFQLQYVSDEWLFLRKVQFLIDGIVYEYVPYKINRDNGNGNIWEWFDDNVSSKPTDMALVIALANAKTAKMKLVGDKYSKEKNITPLQIKSIKQTWELYNAMRGI